MALPTASQLTSATTTNAQMKTYLQGLRDFIANLLGTTETAEGARTALGLAPIATSASAADITTGDLAAARITSALNASGSAPIYAARAWVNFNGSTMAIRGSGNVSSITDNGIGDYTVNFTTPMPDANYCIAGTASRTGTSGSAGVGYTLTANDNVATRSASACRLAVLGNGGDGAFDQLLDSPQVNVVIFR